ncbi:MAG: LysE family translocator [Microthrixaceae bacterium]|nr:LysE family translocator [Microthrixaceae bacterium]
MVDVSRLVVFAGASLALIVVPGPSVLFVIGRGIALGRRAAVLTVVGNAGGAYLQVVAVAAGLGAIVERSVIVYTALKLAGAAYLAYLGIQAIRTRRSLAAAFEDRSVVPRTTAHLVRDGVVVGATNPKVVVFFAAFLPQFVDRSAGHVTVQMLVLGAIFAAIALVSDSLWGLAAGSARNWLRGSPERVGHLGAAGGLVMVGLAVRLALSGRD